VAVDELKKSFKVSERRACQLIEQPRSSQRYESRVADDEPRLLARIFKLVRKFPRYGYRTITRKLRQEGWTVNFKRIYRLWRREGLKVPKKQRKKRHSGSSENGCDIRRADHPDDVWAWDFVFDRTSNGTALKWLMIIDEFTRENLCLHVDRSITSEDVINELSNLFATRGMPNFIRSDNGPEFTANVIASWLEQLDLDILYIAPGSPWQNGYAESFNSRFRDEFLSLEEFGCLRTAKKLTSRHREEYNQHRPHSSLRDLTPNEFASQWPASASVAALPSLQRATATENSTVLT
jgi:putative transposase